MAKTSAKEAAAAKMQSPEELSTALMAKEADLLGYKRSLAAGELTNPRIIGVTRKDIARLKTALAEARQTREGEK